MPHFPSLLNLDKVHVAAFPISSFFFLRQHDVERTWALKSDVSASRSHSPFIQLHDPGELVSTAVLCEAGIVTAALPARGTEQLEARSPSTRAGVISGVVFAHAHPPFFPNRHQWLTCPKWGGRTSQAEPTTTSYPEPHSLNLYSSQTEPVLPWGISELRWKERRFLSAGLCSQSRRCSCMWQSLSTPESIQSPCSI